MRFTVGLKLKTKAEHIVIDAEDALIAALRVKADHPDARIMYVRPQPPRRRPPSAAQPLATLPGLGQAERSTLLHVFLEDVFSSAWRRRRSP